MTRVLVLRPEPGASATVERARARGLDAFAVPLFAIEPLPWGPPGSGAFDGLLLTSANAVRCAGGKRDEFRGLPVYAVGEATAQAARQAGLFVAAVGEADVEGLLGSIEGRLKLLHLCGEDRVSPARTAHQVTPVPVYRAKAIQAPDLSEAKAAVALIHSPRAGRRFAELVRDRGSISIAAISRAAAEAAGRGWERVEFASAPNDDALLALAARLCNKPDPE